MAGLHIERATREDAVAILDLQRVAYRSEAELYGDWSIPPLTQTLDEMREDFDRCLFLQAREDGVLVGSVRARLEGGASHIGRLMVCPECQGQGIGRALMSAIEAQFPQADRFELFTGHRSERNLSLYQRLGYLECRRLKVAAALTLVFLHKSGPSATPVAPDAGRE